MKKIHILVCLFFFTGFINSIAAQDRNVKIKLGAYYFAGWSGENPHVNGTSENSWAKGMPRNATKKLVTEIPEWNLYGAGATMLQDLWNDKLTVLLIMGFLFFSFCWYWSEDKGPINTEKINKNPLHEAMNKL